MWPCLKFFPAPLEPHFCPWESSLPSLIFWNFGIPEIQEHPCSSSSPTPLLSPAQEERGGRKARWGAAASWKHARDLWNSDNFGTHAQEFVSYETVLCGHAPRCELEDTVCSLLHDTQESQRDFIIGLWEQDRSWIDSRFLERWF